MKAVNKKGKKVLEKLFSAAQENDGYIKIDNTNKTFMPVSVEIVGKDLLSVAHYFEQNGDLMADPEMVFMKRLGEFYPISYKLDSLGIYRESVVFLDGKPTHYIKKEQHDEAVFAGQWMENIKEQQGL